MKLTDGGGSMNDGLSLVAKAKDGDYDVGMVGKRPSSWVGAAAPAGASATRSDSGGDFSTNAEGDLDTTLTQDEFGINANAGCNRADWFNTNYDAKAKPETNTTAIGWTYHSESESTLHEVSRAESNGNSSFTFDLSKPTGAKRVVRGRSPWLGATG